MWSMLKVESVACETCTEMSSKGGTGKLMEDFEYTCESVFGDIEVEDAVMRLFFFYKSKSKLQFSNWNTILWSRKWPCMLLLWSRKLHERWWYPLSRVWISLSEWEKGSCLKEVQENCFWPMSDFSFCLILKFTFWAVFYNKKSACS